MQINKIETLNNNKYKINKKTIPVSFSGKVCLQNQDKFVKKTNVSEKEDSIVGNLKNFLLSIFSGNKLFKKEKTPRDIFIEKIKTEPYGYIKTNRRFNKEEIKNLIKLYDKDSEIIEKCVNMRFGDTGVPLHTYELIKDLFDLSRQNRDFVKEALSVKSSYNNYYYSPADIKAFLNETNKKNIKTIQSLLKNCFSLAMIKDWEKRPDFQKRVRLIEEGFSLAELPDKDISDSIYDALMETVRLEKENPNTTRYFLDKIGKDGKLKNNTYSKYQQEVCNIFENMSAKMKYQLIKAKFTEDDFYKSVSKFAKSTFKIAYENPDYYLNKLSFINDVYKNNKYVMEQITKNEKEAIINFFKGNIAVVLRTLKYIDTDTVAHMMDKKFDYFGTKLYELNKISDKNYKLLSKLLSLDKTDGKGKMSPSEKLDLCYIMYVLQQSKVDVSFLNKYVENNSISLDEIKRSICKKYLKECGITRIDKSNKDKAKLNKDFAHLLFLFNSDENKERLLKLIIRKSVNEDFKSYIMDLSNRFGVANNRTKKLFLDRDLSYTDWVNPSIKPRTIKIGDKNLKLKMWERKPQEDLFLGNKTTCCTAITTGTNGDAILEYLLSTAFNVVEICDENNNVVGMARLFMVGVDRKDTAIVIDTIEINNAFGKKLEEEEKTKLRDKLVEYIKDFNKMIIPKNKENHCFSADDTKLSMEDYPKENKEVKFLGKAIGDRVYINCETNWLPPRYLEDLSTTFHIVS